MVNLCGWRMRWVLLVPILYVAAVVQTALGDVLRVGRVEPDLLALTAVIWLLVARAPRSFLVAGGIGLLEDLLAADRLGVSLACFLLVGYAIARLSTRFRLDHLVLRVGTVLAAVSLIACGQTLGCWLLAQPSASLPTLLVRALGVGLYTAGVSLPVLMVLDWLRESTRGVKKNSNMLLNSAP